MPWFVALTNFLPRRIQYLLGLIVFLFGLQVAFRLSFWALISDLPFAFESHLWQAFWIGIRFDLRVAMLAALCTLPWLMIPRFNATNFSGLQRTCQVSVTLLLFSLLTIYVLDAGHYLYLSKRLDASIVRFSTDIHDATLMVWQSYPVVWICLGVAGLLWLCTDIHKRYILSLLQQPIAPKHWLFKIVIVGLFTALLLLMALSRWSVVPLRWNHAYFYGDAEVAALALNPFVWIYDTAKFTNAHISTEQLSPYLPTLTTLLEGNFELNGHSALDRWVTPTAPVIEDEQLNIAIIFLESLGNSHMGASGNPLQPTPHLDQLIAQSRWYPNFIVPVRSTAKSVFTSITGIPDVSAISTATRNPYITHQRSIFNHFQGYEKLYLLGGNAGWANMSATIHNSIEGIKLYDESYWQSPTEDVWGISDGNLFKESVGILKRTKQPFFAFIQTAANHAPHTIPDHVDGFEIQNVSTEDLQAAGFSHNEEYNAVRLLDHNIGYLIKQFKQQGLYENTIFVIFADHQAQGSRVNFLPEYIFQYGIGELPVPLIIHNPKYIAPTIDATFGSLPDLLPTIAGLFSKPYFNTTLGRDLAWAEGKKLPAYGFVQDERKSVVFNGDYIASINHISNERSAAVIEQNTHASPIDIETDAAKTMLTYAQAYYTASQYLLPANVNPKK